MKIFITLFWSTYKSGFLGQVTSSPPMPASSTRTMEVPRRHRPPSRIGSTLSPIAGNPSPAMTPTSAPTRHRHPKLHSRAFLSRPRRSSTEHLDFCRRRYFASRHMPSLVVASFCRATWRKGQLPQYRLQREVPVVAHRCQDLEVIGIDD